MDHLGLDNVELKLKPHRDNSIYKASGGLKHIADYFTIQYFLGSDIDDDEIEVSDIFVLKIVKNGKLSSVNVRKDQIENLIPIEDEIEKAKIRLLGL